MFARVTRTHTKVADIDESVKIFIESIVPAARSQKGFQGILLLSNHEDGEGIAISFWESEADAVANEESHYYQEQLVKRLHLYTKPPIREGYEVSFKLDK